MHFAKSLKLSLFLASLLFVNLQASTFSLDEEILSDSRKESFKLNQEQVEEEAAKLRKDWINPITYKYTKNLGDNYKNEKSVISIDQPIFRSGGIFQAIKYANTSYEYNSLLINQEKKTLILSAVNYLYLIEKASLNIQKSKFVLSNARIDVKRKKEQVFNGFLDSSYLDNALLTLNTSKHTLIDLKYQKQELINNFHNISSKNYKSFKLPHLKILNEKEFLNNNIEIKKAKLDIKKKGTYSSITKAKYLPSVNAFYTYTNNHYTDSSNLNKGSSNAYGLTINVPFDSRTFNDIESTKIDYLKSKLSLKNKISDEKTIFKSILQKIEMLEDRLEVTREDLDIYNSILKIIQEEKDAELKTQSDIDTLQNSQRMKSLDLKIYKIEKQITLLELYSKV